MNLLLEQTVALSKTVKRVVGLTTRPQKAAESVSGVLSGDDETRLIDVGDVELDRGVVGGLDDAVGGRALARNVQFDLTTKKKVSG